MKTLAELEAEHPEDFRNPVRTAAQEAMMEKMHQDRKAHEAAHMAIDDENNIEVDEDEDEEDEEIEE